MRRLRFQPLLRTNTYSAQAPSTPTEKALGQTLHTSNHQHVFLTIHSRSYFTPRETHVSTSKHSTIVLFYRAQRTSSGRLARLGITMSVCYLVICSHLCCATNNMRGAHTYCVFARCFRSCSRVRGYENPVIHRALLYQHRKPLMLWSYYLLLSLA